MSRLLAHRDRFLAHFANRGTLELAGWHKARLRQFQAQGREPVVESFLHADHFTFSSRREKTWTEDAPEIALYLALSFGALPDRSTIIHFSGWGRIAVTDPARIDIHCVEISSSFNADERTRLLRVIDEFQSNHGQLALASRLAPLLEKEADHV